MSSSGDKPLISGIGMISVNDWATKYKDQLLTQEQVKALDRNCLVEVVWSGGNGPHIYRLGEDLHNSMGWVHGSVKNSLTHYYGRVGVEQWDNRVRLVFQPPQ